MEIKPNDIISGALYLKLIQDYRKYDRKQKDLIASLQSKIDFLEWEIDDLRLALEDAEGPSYTKLHTKLKNQRMNLHDCSRSISNLRKENEELKLQIIALNQQIQDLKQANQQ